MASAQYLSQPFIIESGNHYFTPSWSSWQLILTRKWYICKTTFLLCAELPKVNVCNKSGLVEQQEVITLNFCTLGTLKRLWNHLKLQKEGNISNSWKETFRAIKSIHTSNRLAFKFYAVAEKRADIWCQKANICLFQSLKMQNVAKQKRTNWACWKR